VITDKELKPRRGEVKWIVLKNPNYLEQIDQVLAESGLGIDEARLFSRCLVCNSVLEPAAKEDVAGEVPEFTYAIQDEYARCRTCPKALPRPLGPL
jgi:uncharacterized protein with PIN domain